MKKGVIIFARMSSSRLPGKSLMDIAGRSLLGHVLDRSKLIGDECEVIIATSDQSSDDPIARFAKQEGVGLFRGELDDVAGRGLACAQQFGLDCFARVCGDRPFFDPEIVVQLFAMLDENDADLATNVAEKSYPPGATAEVMLTAALQTALEVTDASLDREHVTRYFYNHPEDFRIVNLRAPAGLDKEVSLVVDIEEDLERARYIATHLGERVAQVGIGDVIELARSWYARKT